jgi:glycosyltransferase involved in cell wall biosynthesis
MKIVLYCYAFSPTIGGIQTIAETLATNFVKLGHTCTVVTESLSNESDSAFSFDVYRRPSKLKILSLLKNADIVYNIELSMKFFVLCKLAQKKLVWVHNGYKLMCIDALGWYLDKPAPIEPMRSIKFYIKECGYSYALIEGFKLYARRWAASNIYLNIAATKWIASRQPLKNQVQLYTPYLIDRFLTVKDATIDYNFLFVGRLVREKGVDTLLNAFKVLVTAGFHDVKMAIVGYGIDEQYLKQLCDDLDISNSVHFLGPKKGNDLLDIISRCEIGVIPSYWEEPMGGISLELMAAGKIVIVSKNGGMPEVIGEAGLTFENGNHIDLSEKMKLLLTDEPLRNSLKSSRMSQVAKFDPMELSSAYLEIIAK